MLTNKKHESDAERQDMNQGHPFLVPCIVTAIFLLGALVHWPYGYYILLRWMTCVCAIYLAVKTHNKRFMNWSWSFGFIALLFNPVVPVQLTRNVWQPIDIFTAAVFFFAALVLKE
jgi:hypothetical protein